jgi:MscS family membrane protein
MLYCFLACPDWGTELREKQRLFLDVLRVAKELGVSFAFPTQTIHVARPEDREHPDSPATDVEGTRRGRTKGRAVAEKTLKPFGGAAPTPVGFDEDYFEEQVRGE